MAASCCSTPVLISLPRQSLRTNGIAFAPPISMFKSQPDRLSIRVGTRKSAHSVCVSCLGDAKVAVVTGKSWDKLILNNDTPVLVEFSTTWCGPCQIVRQLIDEIATDYSGRLKCFVLDTDNEAQLAKNYGIKALPVVLVFKNGKKHDFIVGTMPKKFYVDAIERVLAS